MQGKTVYISTRQENLKYLLNTEFPYYVDLNLDGTANVFCKEDVSFIVFYELAENDFLKELEEKEQNK